ncbi:MAG: hypothetical protein ACLGIV_09530 [Actinomycetes bacterium]
MTPGHLLAHGIGGRGDLPLPFGFALTGAALALVVSFLALGLLWPSPRLDGGRAGRSSGLARALQGDVRRRLLGAAGLALAALTLLAAFAGPSDTRNALPFVVYVLVWVGVVPLSLLLGPATWAHLSPWRTVHELVCRAARVDPAQGVLPLPARLGWWPAAVGLTAFVWLELVSPSGTDVGVLRLVVVAYAALQLLAGFVLGSGWFDRGDFLEAWSGLLGLLSPVGRRDDGVAVLRSPLAGLDQLRASPGLAATVVVMLGSTAYDSVREHPTYVGAVQSGPLPRTLADTLALGAVLGVVAVAFWAASASAGRLGGTRGGGAATRFAPSLVPIALGYVVAHYYSFLVLEGQNAVVRLSDPLGTGGGLTGRAADATLVAPGIVATVQLVAIVAGHVLGVVLAHDRAVRLFPRSRAVVGQLPLLVLMVAYTVGGLLLLFAA